MQSNLLDFREIWLVDFEFDASRGNRPVPVCLVAKEYRSAKVIRMWKGEFEHLQNPPYSLGVDSLFVAFNASSEFTCHLALNWPLPSNVLDLRTEFRILTNGRNPPSGNGLLGALIYFGLDAMSVSEKEHFRNRVLQGEPFSEAEKLGILDYCQSDVEALQKLLPHMLPDIDPPPCALSRALHEGSRKDRRQRHPDRHRNLGRTAFELAGYSTRSY
jgi:DNA polymerase-1